MVLDFLLTNPGATVIRVSASQAQAEKILKGAMFDSLAAFPWLRPD
jgi:hypothetical protein